MRFIERVLVAVCACVVFAGATGLHGQTRADSAAVLLNAAEQLRLRGDAAAARAVLELITRQYAGTPAAQDVERALALLRRMPDAERSGRTELLVSGALYGAWLGVAVPLALDVDGPEGYGIGLLLGAPLGFVAAKAYADSKMPTEGQTRALTFGGLWGTYQGFALAEVLDLGSTTETLCPEPGDCFEVERGGDASAYVTAAVAGGLLGIGTGAFLARRPITSGTAAAVTLGGMWGTWFGFALSFLADQAGDDLLAGTMIGGNVALLGMGLAAPRWHMSESRARLISVGGLAGGLAGAGVLLIAQPDGNKAILVPLLGSVAGLALAAQATRARDDIVDDGSGRGALINRSGDRWALDTPAASLRVRRKGSGDLPLAVYVPLLRARF